MQTKSKFRECAFVKANGARCASPALRGQSLCFFHHPQAREEHRIKQLTLRPHPAKTAIRDIAKQWPDYISKDQRGLLTYAFNLMMRLEPLSAAQEIALARNEEIALARNKELALGSAETIAPSHFLNKSNVR